MENDCIDERDILSEEDIQQILETVKNGKWSEPMSYEEFCLHLDMLAAKHATLH